MVVEIPGSRRPRKIVVLGAHYDTIAATPGADDNASAVAVLLEVARLMAAWCPERTVRFVAFPCEEPPYFHTGEMGSQTYARACRAATSGSWGCSVWKWSATTRRRWGSNSFPRGFPVFSVGRFRGDGDFLAAVGNLRSWRLLRTFRRGFKRAVKFPLFSIALPEWIGAIRLSDNSSFWDQGYPALMLTDTSFLRNPHYHQASDTPETLDYESMAAVVLGVVGGLARVARARRAT